MMKSLFFLFVVILNYENVTSKSLENDFLDTGLEVEERSTSKANSEDRVIWKLIDTNHREESLTNKEEITSGNDFLEQKPTNLQMVSEDVVKEMASENEMTFETQPFSNNSLAEILDGQNTIANDTDLDKLSETSLSIEMEPPNLTPAIVIDFSNITGDAIVIDVFSENTEDDVDEVSEMRKGEEIAFLHEMPTSSFEFLIDSQTRRNILLKELLGSQTILSVEDDIEPQTFPELDHSLSTTDLHSRGDNFEDLMLNDKSVPFGSKSEEEMAREDAVNEATSIFEETELGNGSEDVVSECPQPGWCIFWFLSQDTCAINSHCLGSRICCRTGCSKTCVDV